MTTCEPCALREAGNTDRAEAIEVIRGHRLLRAMLRGSAVDTGMIFSELHGCHDCLARLASQYLGATAMSLAAIHGSAEAAITAIEHSLAETIYDQQDGV